MRIALLVTALLLAVPGVAAAAGPGPLAGEPSATAAGDIPDNQVFLTFASRGAGWSMKVPEGWAQRRSGSSVTFRDKNNVVRVVVRRGPAPTVTAVRRDVAKLHLTRAPAVVRISGAPAVKVGYTTVSPPSPVTGKRLTLVVDRYYLVRAGSVAVVDLGTPVGVDNVDAYRLMVESFRWR